MPETTTNSPVTAEAVHRLILGGTSARGPQSDLGSGPSNVYGSGPFVSCMAADLDTT